MSEPTVFDRVKEWQNKNPEASLAAALKAVGVSTNQYYYSRDHAGKKTVKRAAAQKASQKIVTTRRPKVDMDSDLATFNLKSLSGRMALVLGSPEQLRQLLGNF